MVTHPTCSPSGELEFEQVGDSPFDADLKRRLTEIILWADRNSDRSLQREIGPSEIGGACDRRIAYRLAEMDPINLGFDPWAAIVGTATHAWLEKAFTRWVDSHYDEAWKMETTVQVDQSILGHCDLYHDGTVIDWKTAGPDVMKKVSSPEGIPDAYKIQVQVYGLGFERAGHKVQRVALAFLPRAGLLRNMIVWSAEYDRLLAEAALSRVYQIAQQTVDLDVLNQSHRWQQIEATPGDWCGICPWYNSLRTREDGASDKGCPGN